MQKQYTKFGRLFHKYSLFSGLRNNFFAFLVNPCNYAPKPGFHTSPPLHSSSPRLHPAVTLWRLLRHLFFLRNFIAFAFGVLAPLRCFVGVRYRLSCGMGRGFAGVGWQDCGKLLGRLVNVDRSAALQTLQSFLHLNRIKVRPQLTRLRYSAQLTLTVLNQDPRPSQGSQVGRRCLWASERSHENGLNIKRLEESGASIAW
jgi:hypothetical protein